MADGTEKGDAAQRRAMPRAGGTELGRTFGGAAPSFAQPRDPVSARAALLLALGLFAGIALGRRLCR
ncbi:MAG: hypothetical protein U1F37_17930 [Alphaproteobacteria bacterium]